MDWFQMVGQSRNRFYSYKKLLKNIHLSQKIRAKPFYTTKFTNTISNRCDTFIIYISNRCVDRTVINLDDPHHVEWFETYVQCAGFKRGKYIIKKYLSHLGKVMTTYQSDDSTGIEFPIKCVENDEHYKEK